MNNEAERGKEQSENITPKKYGKKLIVVSLAFAFFAVIIIVLSVKWSSQQLIKSVSVSGNRIIPTSEIRAFVGDSLLNLPNEKIKLEAIRRKLRSHPYVLMTYISHKSPEELNIEVKERCPVAALVNNDGAICFIDEQGFTLPYRLFENFADLPVIRNIYITDRIDKSALNFCFSVLTELRKKEYCHILSGISEIVYDSASGNCYCLAGNKGIKILYGKFDKIVEKTKNLLTYWNSEQPLVDGSTVRYIDLRWDGTVVAGL